MVDFHVAEEDHGIQAAVPIEISIWPESDSNGEEREVCREHIGSLCLLLHVSLCEVSGFTQGRSRKHGLGVGHHWSALGCSCINTDVLMDVVQLQRCLQNAEYTNSPLLLPDLQTKSRGSDTYDDIQMPAGKFGQLLVDPGLNSVTKTRTFNALGRFFPTDADVLDMDDTFAAVAGHISRRRTWKEEWVHDANGHEVR